MKSIFLGRSGEFFGPFTATEIDELRRKGELDRFRWIWHGEGQWQPLDPMPPLPPSAELTQAPQPASPLPPASNHEVQPPAQPARPSRLHQPAPVMRSVPNFDSRHIEALCHDSRHVVSGKLTRISEQGCEFIAESEESMPAFSRQGHLVLSMLDPTSGRAMNVPARLAHASRSNGAWTYRLVWESLPELFLTA